MKNGFQIADLEFKVAPTGASDSGVGLPCGTIVMIWWLIA